MMLSATLDECARQILRGEKTTLSSVTSFVDEPPLSLDPVLDSMVAALAEHLCASRGTPTPEWAISPFRMAIHPYFSSEQQALSLLHQSPAAFRKRNLFIYPEYIS